MSSDPMSFSTYIRMSSRASVTSSITETNQAGVPAAP